MRTILINGHTIPMLMCPFYSQGFTHETLYWTHFILEALLPMFESMGSAHMYDPHVMFQPAYLILPVIPQSSECFSNLTYCIWEKLISMINILYMYVFLFEDIGEYRRTHVAVRKIAGFKFVEHCYHILCCIILYMFIYTCIYIYIHIYLYIFIYIYIYLYIFIYIYI